MEPSFWITSTLAYLEFLEDGEVSYQRLNCRLSSPVRFDQLQIFHRDRRRLLLTSSFFRAGLRCCKSRMILSNTQYTTR